MRLASLGSRGRFTLSKNASERTIDIDIDDMLSPQTSDNTDTGAKNRTPEFGKGGGGGLKKSKGGNTNLNSPKFVEMTEININDSNPISPLTVPGSNNGKSKRGQIMSPGASR